MKNIKEIEYLIDAFRSLPGVGTKNAKKYSIFLANQDDNFINEFIKRINDVHQNIHKCNLCNNLTNNKLCDICVQKNRQPKLCIVSYYEDFERIESTKVYNGYYYVLFGELDIRKNPNFDFIDIQKIITLINSFEIKEVIIATSFSNSGELTSNYLFSKLSHINHLNICRLGFGIPLNANIDYIDDETIKESFKNKKLLNH